VFSEWNSSPLVKDTTKLGKKKKLLTPATFSLIHSTDFADRTERSILPLLKAGAVVLCDRISIRICARCGPRMDREWVRDLYDFAMKRRSRSTFAFRWRRRSGACGRSRWIQILRSRIGFGLTDDAGTASEYSRGGSSKSTNK